MLFLFLCFEVETRRDLKLSCHCRFDSLHDMLNSRDFVLGNLDALFRPRRPRLIGEQTKQRLTINNNLLDSSDVIMLINSMSFPMR